MQRRRITLGEVTLGCTTAGRTGTWVTLLHGGLMHSVTWDGLVAPLAASARVLAPDLRGYGASSLPPGGYAMADLAADIVGLWDALDVRRSVLVGFSMGGFVALETVARAPERVSALALIGTAAALTPAAREAFAARADALEGPDAGAQLTAHVERVFSPAFARDHADVVAGYRRALAEQNPAAVAASFRAIAGYDRSDTVSQVVCPAIVVCGEHDAAIPPDAGRALAAMLPRGRLTVLEGAGHTVHLEQPGPVCAILADLLEEVASDSC